MNKKMLLLGLMLSAISAGTAYGASVDINVTAKLIKPLEMKKSHTKIVGQALAATSGTQTLTPITVSFLGGQNASIKFTADQNVTLTGGSDALTLSTTVNGGSVTSTGTKINSDLVLSSAGESAVTLGGTVNLSGTEPSQTYAGTMDIAVDYN